MIMKSNCGWNEYEDPGYTCIDVYCMRAIVRPCKEKKSDDDEEKED